MNRPRSWKHHLQVLVLALVALLLPVVLGSFSTLHTHPIAGCHAELPAASESPSGNGECPFCALSRNPGQVIPGGVLEPCRSQPVAGLLPANLTLPKRPVPADAAPRAPPVCDSIWNV